MQKKNTFKGQEGVISVYVGVCIVTFILILTAIYTVAVAVRKNQIKTLIKVKEVYEQDNTKIASIYEKQKRVLLEKLEVGETVTYNPNGSYNWNKAYATSDQTGTEKIESGTGKSFNISNWKVLSIDKQTGKVQLISSTPTTGTVRFQGAQGYNNAVKLLNDACSELYGNSAKGIEARSINIEDIEKYMTDTAISEVHSYVNTDSNTTYGNKVSSTYTSYKNYPIVYGEEIKSVINGTEKTTGLGLSEQSRLIERSEGTSTSSSIGAITSATSIQPYQTHWRAESSYMQSAFKEYKEGANYYNILLPSGIYWLASRYVIANANYCDFCIRTVSSVVGGSSIFASNNSNNECTYSMLPIVTLDISSITYDVDRGYIVK